MISVGNQSHYAMNVVALLGRMHSEIDRNFITSNIIGIRWLCSCVRIALTMFTQIDTKLILESSRAGRAACVFYALHQCVFRFEFELKSHAIELNVRRGAYRCIESMHICMFKCVKEQD